ncbi:MAG: BamA/TamA family outer membrane protein, partial [Chitinivibrionales bacterium]|nr:BamA/TamA family outer membrane protein [Chitinivibrionales bacterium]
VGFSKIYCLLTPQYINNYFPDASFNNTFYEAFIGAGWQTDRRDVAFDPALGWYLSSEARANRVYSTDTHKFIQVDSDYRLYLHGFFSHDKFALWAKGYFRDRDAGPFRTLAAGGEGSLRGYPAGFFGGTLEANNGAFFSAEYRWPIWESEPFNIFMLEEFYAGLKDFFYRVDGTLILDGGVLWDKFSEKLLYPFSTDEHGLGAGFGVRVLVPTMRQSLRADIVFPFYSNVGLQFTSWPPMLHLYIDYYF